MTRIEALPDDPTLLKQMVLDRDVLIERIKNEATDRLDEQAQRHAEQTERIREEAAEQLEALRQRLEAEKKAAIEAILRRLYGPKNERFDPRQLLLFGGRVEELPLDEPSIVEEAGQELTTRRITKKHKHGRNPLPDHLPRIEIEHDLNDAEKPCPCCGELRVRIGQEVSEQLEYLPASFKVLRHVRHKYPASPPSIEPAFSSRRSSCCNRFQTPPTCCTMVDIRNSFHLSWSNNRRK